MRIVVQGKAPNLFVVRILAWQRKGVVWCRGEESSLFQFRAPYLGLRVILIISFGSIQVIVLFGVY